MAFITKKLEGEWVTLNCDPAKVEEEKTRWFIQPMDAFEVASLQDKYTYTDIKEQKNRTDWFKGMIETVALGLKDVANLLNSKGDEVKIEFEEVTYRNKKVSRPSHKFLEVLPIDAISELAMKIRGISELTEENKEDLNCSNPE